MGRGAGEELRDFTHGTVWRGVEVSRYVEDSLDVATGRFFGDGRSQVALAYRVVTNTALIRVALFPVGGGYRPGLPGPVLEVGLPDERIDNFRFSLATGDFLGGDGVDELAVATLGTGEDAVACHLRSAFTAESGRREPETGIAGGWSGGFLHQCSSGSDIMAEDGMLEATSGDLDGDGLDELAMVGVTYCAGGAKHSFKFRTVLVDVVYPLYPDMRGYVVASGSLEGEDYYYGLHYDAWSTAPVRSVGLTITAGDVDGDGQDELVRTWPEGFLNGYAHVFARFLQVLKLPANPDPGKTWGSRKATELKGVIDELQHYLYQGSPGSRRHGPGPAGGDRVASRPPDEPVELGRGKPDGQWPGNPVLRVLRRNLHSG